ncbi:MAG: histone deacetylase superfamily [Acidobacteria bacterium]|nr:histone deacetylase superfamily [Acidobacteriota bacterium]
MARALRRLLWSARRRLAGQAPVELVVAPDGSVRLPGGLVDPWRATRILAFLEERGLVDRRRVRRAAAARLSDLAPVHDLDYLEGLERPGATAKAFGAHLGDRLEQDALDAHRAQVGATLLAARRALETGGVAVHLGGGFHHAHRGRGAGFCLLNDVAVAIAAVRQAGFDGPVAVIDLDLHDGDGTRSIFLADPTVHTYSIHNRPWDDLQGPESSAFALGSGVEDARYLGVLGDTLPPLLDRFRPRLAFLLAGVDPAEDDSLGDWRITAGGLVARDALVLGELARRRVPAVVLLAGGYGEDAWRHSARSLSRLLSGGVVLEPPSTSETLVTRFRGLAEELPAALLGGYGDELLSAEDLEEVLGASPAQRFLGFYTRAGLEVALERLGYLEEVRRLGFDAPLIDLDLGGADGDTLRVFGAPDRRELLVELRVRRDRRAMPGFELLWVEWLLLQNPRLPFGGEREPLPGQAHPGLGMLRETMAALVLVCDRLKLDGIGVAAAHFHPAANSPGEMRLLDPAEAALFRSMVEAVRGRPAREACLAVERDGLVDEETGERVAWRPFNMIFPVSARLREWFERPEYVELAQAPGPRLRRADELEPAPRPAGAGDRMA